LRQLESLAAKELAIERRGGKTLEKADLKVDRRVLQRSYARGRVFAKAVFVLGSV